MAEHSKIRAESTIQDASQFVRQLSRTLYKSAPLFSKQSQFAKGRKRMYPCFAQGIMEKLLPAGAKEAKPILRLCSGQAKANLKRLAGRLQKGW